MADLTALNYWPLGSTVSKTFSFTQPTTKQYEHFGLISINPISGHTIMIYRKGNIHVGYPGNPDYGEIWIRHSYDGGSNWETESQAFLPESNIDQRGVAGGYDSNGRLFAFYGRYNPNSSTLTWLSMNYRYSDNDGKDWSKEFELAKQSPIQSPNINNAFLPYGHILDDGNNILYQTWYGFNANNNSYSIYLYKSTDGGLTFSNVIIIYTGTNVYTEPSMVKLGGGCFITLTRINGGNYRQFKSEDNCENWTDQGNTSFETWSSDLYQQAPPFLNYINFEGVGIVACYYTVRKPQNQPYYSAVKVVYALAKDLLNGVNGWNLSPIKVIYTFPSGYTRSGYQSFFQPLNQYNGIGICFEDLTTASPEIAYPLVKFTNISGMHDVLIALGL